MGGEMHVHIIVLTQPFHTSRGTDALVLTCHMVGNKVQDDLHASLVRTFNQGFKLSHALLWVFSQVGIYIIIVGDGIRRASFSFHYLGILLRNSVCGIVGGCCMTDDACIPNMGHSHLFYLPEHLLVDIVKFRTAVFCK